MSLGVCRMDVGIRQMRYWVLEEGLVMWISVCCFCVFCSLRKYFVDAFSDIHDGKSCSFSRDPELCSSSRKFYAHLFLSNWMCHQVKMVPGSDNNSE
jgi:hypothetical protein